MLLYRGGGEGFSGVDDGNSHLFTGLSPLRRLSYCVLCVLCGAWLQDVLRQRDPSSRLVLYGCASASVDESCSTSVSSGFGFEWAQVYHPLHSMNKPKCAHHDYTFHVIVTFVFNCWFVIGPRSDSRTKTCVRCIVFAKRLTAGCFTPEYL